MQFRRCGAGAGLTHLRQAQQACAVAYLLQLPLGRSKEVFYQRHDSFNLSLDIEIVVKVSLGEVRSVGGMNILRRAPGCWSTTVQRGWPCCFRLPDGAVPQAYANIANRRKAEYVLQ